MDNILIATGDNARSRDWRNCSMPWADFVRLCTTTKRTPETLAEYSAMQTDEQTRTKDVGGFVPGRLRENGARNKDNIAARTLLVFDLDFATVDFVDRFKSAYHGAAICYSTHKHTPENPRYRVVMPMNRDIEDPIEYEALSRKVCERLGLLEETDKTTHEYSRLFFWPSTSTGAEFISWSQEGAPLDVDKELESYNDWHNCTEWPLHPAELPRTITGKKPGDPTEKPGLIGAFCRAYTIEDAIEKFLPDVYERTATEGRYTYRGGTVAGGCVTYEGMYAYLHNKTDPASMKLCNAFDLVRIHKFGNLDSNAKPGTPVNKLPSYVHMSELCSKDDKTKHELMADKYRQAQEDFAGLGAEVESGAGTDDSWEDNLDVDRKGNPQKTQNNLALIMINDPVLKTVRYDCFAGRDVSGADELRGANGTGRIEDEQYGKIALYIERKYSISYKPNAVADVLTATRSERAFNPVKDFIQAAVWDGMPRIDRLLIEYLGAEDTATTREITRKWIVAAVARVFNPGCTFQNVLTLAGPQGTGKSTFFKTLAADWFSDTLNLAAPYREQLEAVRGAWIVEITEMSGHSRADWEALKGFISRSTDRARAAYARTVSETPRQFVACATTNRDDFLRDSSLGNRRWWVIGVNGAGRVRDWIERLRAEVPQIWAEAYALYLAGEDICNPSDEAEMCMQRRQLEFSEDRDDPLPGEIEAYLDMPLPTDWARYNRQQRLGWYRDYDPLKPEGSVRRDAVSAIEFYWEAKGRELKGNNADVQKFKRVMRSLPDWTEKAGILCGPYGRQRGFTRNPIEAGPDDDDL